MLRTVAATIEGQTELPAAVATALADGVSAHHRKVSSLQALAFGAIVADLARRAGYSELARFRLLRALHREMRVNSRLKALMRARERGLM